MLFHFDTGPSILLRVNRHSGYGNLEKRLVTLTKWGTLICIFYLQECTLFKSRDKKDIFSMSAKHQNHLEETRMCYIDSPKNLCKLFQKGKERVCRIRRKSVNNFLCSTDVHSIISYNTVLKKHSNRVLGIRIGAHLLVPDLDTTVPWFPPCPFLNSNSLSHNIRFTLAQVINRGYELLQQLIWLKAI